MFQHGQEHTLTAEERTCFGYFSDHSEARVAHKIRFSSRAPTPSYSTKELQPKWLIVNEFGQPASVLSRGISKCVLAWTYVSL